MAAGGAIKAGAAFVELWLNDARLTRGLKRAQARLKAFGASMRAMGSRMIAMGALIAAPLIIAVRHFARLGDQLQKMAARTGISVRALSEFQFAAERSGSSLETFEKGVRRMQRTITDANRGLATAQDGFRMLGIAGRDLAGLSPEDQFILIADAISRIEDPTRKAAIAQMIFGRAGAELIPLMNEGAAGMERLRERARQLRHSFSGADADAAAAFNDALSDLWTTLKDVAFHVGAALGTSLTDAAVKVSDFVAGIIDWVKENRQLVIWIAKVAAILVIVGTAIVIVGAVFSGMAAIIGGLVGLFGFLASAVTVLGAVFAWLVSPIGLAVAAVVGLGAVILTQTQAGADALKWLGDMFAWLADDAASTWSGMSDAMAAGDMALAAKVAMLSVKLVLSRAMHGFSEIVAEAVTGWRMLWTEAVFGMAKVATLAWAGLQVAWQHVIGFMSDAWDIFTGGLQSTFLTAVAFISKAWQKLKGAVTGKDTSGEQTRVDDELKAAQATRRDAQKKRIFDREQRRKKDLATIAGESRGALDILDAEQKKQQRDRMEAHRADMDGTRTGLDNAKRRLKDAVEKAKADRKALQRPEPPEAPATTKGPDLSFLGNKLKKNAKAGFTQLTDQSETRGTFSAFAVRGMQSGGPMERIARSTAATALAAAAIVDNTADMGLPTF